VNGDESEGSTQADANRRAEKKNPATRREQNVIAPGHGPFRDAAVGAARLSSAALTPNPLRAVLRGMRGIRHHAGSIRTVATLSLNPNLDQNSLARELGIDRTNVADVLNRLARRGLVERRRSPNDARMVLARLTRAGDRLTRKMYRPMQRAQKRLLSPLLPQERNTLMITLIRLINGNNHLGRTIFQPS
jgi:DNA-binding MarR family transcriptional regulator